MNQPDNFRYSWRNIRRGEMVYINHEGQWRLATVSKCDRDSVTVEFSSLRQKRLYEELRRKI